MRTEHGTRQNRRLGGTAALMILLMVSALSRAGVSQAAVTLVADGRARAAIVVPERASRGVREGAEVLRDHLSEISGARLSVLYESELEQAKVVAGRIEGETAADVFVLVGEGRFARQLGITSDGLGPGGIVIRSFGNGVAMLGADEKTPSDRDGSRYAVTTFLEDELGCRYLWPGQSGKVVPKRRTITVGPLDTRHTPLFKQRNIRWSSYSSRIQEGLDRLCFSKESLLQARDDASRTRSQSGDWMKWHRMGGTLGLSTGDGTILPAETWVRFLKEYPEWFAMQRDGSRFFDASWDRPRLCKSNAALIEAIAREKIKELDGHPGQRSVSLMTQDGGSKAGFCLCPACKALDPPQGRPTRIWTYSHQMGRTERFDYVSLTDRMAHFYNAIAAKVAKQYPDVLFTGQAYSVYASPPLREKLHPNVVIRLVHRTDHYANDEVRSLGMADWDAWATAVGMIFWRPNSLLWGRHEGTTGIYVHRLAEDFRHIAQNKCVGTDFDSCMHHWASQGLNYYVLAKLHWNANLDVDQAVDDYCRSGFGQASVQVKRYLMRIEELTNKTSEKPGRDINSKTTDVTESYTPEVISELGSLLDAAVEAARADTEALRRIAFLRIGLDFTQVQAEIYRLLRLSRERRLEPAERATATELLDHKYGLMRKIFQEDHYAINVAAMCWGEWGRFKRLGWVGPSRNHVAETE